MKPEVTRPFTMLDAMGVVLATGLGLGVIKAAGFDRWPESGTFRSIITDYTAWAVCLTLPMLAAWTVVCLSLRWHNAETRRRNRAWPPGMLACAAATAALLYTSTWTILYAVKWGAARALDKGFLPTPTGFCWQLAQDVGPWVAAVWLGAVLLRRWRPEPTWLDRLGRGLGLAWIVATLVLNGYLLLLP